MLFVVGPPLVYFDLSLEQGRMGALTVAVGLSAAHFDLFIMRYSIIPSINIVRTIFLK